MWKHDLERALAFLLGAVATGDASTGDLLNGLEAVAVANGLCDLVTHFHPMVEMCEGAALGDEGALILLAESAPFPGEA